MSETDRREFLQQASGMVAALAIAPDLVGAPVRLREPLEIGLIGAGKRGRQILSELARFENVKVSAVCDVQSRRLRSGLRRAGGEAEGFENYREMLDRQKNLQAVVLATPTYQHREIAEDLLRAGKHVYCEAPMASSVVDLKAITKAARSASTIFQVGHTARSNPVYKLAWSFFRSGSLRDLVALRAQYHFKSSWRLPSSDPARDKEINWRLYRATSGGLVGEEGSHQIDTIFWYTEKLPTAVRGTGAILAYDDGREVEDTVQCVFDYPEGLRMLYDATIANSFEARYELLVGTMGTIKLAERFGWLFKEADAPIQGWEVYASRERFHNEEGITLIADATKLAAQGKLKEGIGLPFTPLYYALESFLKSIQEGTPPACDAMAGLAAAAVALRANEAVVSGEMVAIEPDLFKI